MAVTSINMVRVSHNMRTISTLDSLRQNTLSLFLEQNRLSSGNKLNAPSEDPVAANHALQLTQALEHQDQVLANIRHADSFLATTDSAIGEINDLLIEAHSIASEMVNTTADQAQRDSMAELIRGMIDQMVLVGNRTYGGVYLFGGQQTTSTPFTQQSGGVEYQGDTAILTTDVGLEEDPAINLTGYDVFGSLSSVVSGVVDLDPVLMAETRLADVDGAAGVGIEPSQIRISLDTPAVSFVVDLSKADTVGDVVDYINQAASDAGLTTGAGGQFNATINGAGNGLQLATPGVTVSVQEISEGVTARDLGLLGSGLGGVNGSDLNPQVTLTTEVASLFAGTGAALGSIRIENGTLVATVDLSGATTVQDILNRINSAGVQVKASINAGGTGIDVVSKMSGADLHIGEAGGTAAELLGIRTLYGGTQVSDLNDGIGLRTETGKADIRITSKDGTVVDVNLDGAQTIQDVLDAINNAAVAAGASIAASLATTGNGIRLADSSGGAGTLSTSRLNYSMAIDDLGLNKQVDNPAATELIGDDTNGIKTDSVFTALIELYDALVSGGPEVEQNITRAAEKINTFIDRSNRLQGVIGARSRAMSIRLELTEDAVVSTTSLLSQIKDLDYTEAVTKFQQAQTALQANLMTSSRLLQLSLLDFIG